MEIKKTHKADLERQRWKMFIGAFVLVCSIGYVLLNWNFSFSDDIDAEMLEEVIENIDFEKLKKNNDMVTAVTETEDEVDVTNIKPLEIVLQQPQEQPQPTISQEMEKTEIPDAQVEEIRDQVMQKENDVPEGLHAIEELPEFPGGSGAFMKWITANIKYPASARNRKVKGKVVVSFIIDVEGDVQELKLEKFNNTLLADAVLKAMKTMPKWKPGKQRGVPCSTIVAVPVNFEL